MIPVVRAIVALAVGALLSPCTPVYGHQERQMRRENRRLDEALAELQKHGLRIIYSSEIVRPEMRVPAAPLDLSALRRMLDEWLSPHGLIASNGPGGTVLIVKNPRVRLRAPPPPSRSAIASDTDGMRRFEETVNVIEKEPGAVTAGPSPFTVGPLDAGAMAGGFENVFRALQALPGVTSTDELGSRIAVRGGGPDQNLTIMDGVEIHNPFRLVIAAEDLAMVGLSSMFNVDTLDHVELYPGAFDVRYGDRLSSLLIVKHREGSEAEAFQGSSFVSLAESNVILEGKLPRRVSGSWLLSARRSHLDLVFERVTGAELPSFQDVDARISWRPRPTQRVLLVTSASRERTRDSNTAAVDASRATSIRNDLLALTFEAGVGRRAFSRTVASVSRFTDTLRADERSFDNSRGANTVDSIAAGELLAYQLFRDIAVQDLSLRQEFVFSPSARHALDLGVETHWLNTRWAWTISGDRSLHQPNGSSVRLGSSLPDVLDSSRNSSRVGVWVQNRWQVSEQLVLQPGLRLEYSSLTGQKTLSPRLGGTLNLRRALRLDAALRLHSQSPGYEKVLQSDYFMDLSPRRAVGIKAERAFHAVAGLQQDFGGGLSARVDAYYKRFSDLLVGRLETDQERLARLDGDDVPATLLSSVPTHAQITTSPVNAATGDAYGFEVYVADAGRTVATPLTGWASYSFARADRTAYGVTHPFDYDRRHSLSATANFRIGQRLDLSVTGRWGSGLPRTPVRGVRLALAPDTGDVDEDGNRDEQVPQRDTAGHPLFQPDLGGLENLNTARLPHFARVDVRFSYRPSWSGERWAFYLDLVNLLNAKNVTKIDSALVLDALSDRPRIIERAEDRGIPFFPSIGIRFWF